MCRFIGAVDLLVAVLQRRRRNFGSRADSDSRIGSWTAPTRMNFFSSEPANDAAALPRAGLHPAHAVSLIVGIVIGAGIFKAPAIVAELTGAPLPMFAAWLLGGLASLIGALCYAELCTAYPHAGGDYHFVGRAYGKPVAFLFAWARFAVITTGSIALLAFIFGDYLQLLLPLPGLAPAAASATYAALAVILLTLLNLRGLRAGTRTQTLLTLAEAGGLLLIVGAALTLPAAQEPATHIAPSALPSTAIPDAGAFGLGMVFVMLSFGGWNEAAYVSAELKDSRRMMVRVLLASIAIITALYLMVIWAYWHGLGLAGMAGAEAVAASLLYQAFGSTGLRVMALLVMIATLTSINATIIVGARASFAAGRDWQQLRRLGDWDSQRNTPANALCAQCLMVLLLVAIGMMAGDGFRAMVEFTAPVFWLFFLLSGLSLFMLRWREPDTPRPFRVPWYPLTPALFCAACAGMLWSSLQHVSRQSLAGVPAAWVGVGLLLAGLALLLFMRRVPPSAIHHPERSSS